MLHYNYIFCILVLLEVKMSSKILSPFSSWSLLSLHLFVFYISINPVKEMDQPI